MHVYGPKKVLESSQTVRTKGRKQYPICIPKTSFGAL